MASSEAGTIKIGTPRLRRRRKTREVADDATSYGNDLCSPVGFHRGQPGA